MWLWQERISMVAFRPASPVRSKHAARRGNVKHIERPHFSSPEPRLQPTRSPWSWGRGLRAGSDRAGPGTAGFPRAERPEAGQGRAAAILRAGGGRMAAGGWCGHRALRALRAASGSHWGRPAVPGEAGGYRGVPGGALFPAVAFPRGGRERGAHGLRLSCRAQGGRWQLPPPLRRGGARRDLRGAERAEKIQCRPHRCAGEVGG